MSGLLTRNVLVISQKPKFVEMTNEYEITGEDGTLVGSIRQEGQSKARKLLRLVSSVEQSLTHTLAVYDADAARSGSAWMGRRSRSSARSTLRTGVPGTSPSTTSLATRSVGSRKKWAGILREGFTTADHYLLHISGDVSGPLRTLMVASAAGVDTALKQDDTGGFGFGGIDLDI